MADVTLPQLGETVTEGTITRWFKKVGDTIAADEALFEVSTDKVDTEVPSPVAGVVLEIRAAEGDTVPVGAVIAVVGAPAPPPRWHPHRHPHRHPSSSPHRPRPVTPAPAPGRGRCTGSSSRAPAAAPAVPEPAPALRSDPRPLGNDNRLLSPVVRRLVSEHAINPDDIVGTGPGGRITRDDVLDYIDRHDLDARRPRRPGRSRRRARPPVAPAPAPGRCRPVAAAAPSPVHRLRHLPRSVAAWSPPRWSPPASATRWCPSARSASSPAATW